MPPNRRSQNLPLTDPEAVKQAKQKEKKKQKRSSTRQKEPSHRVRFLEQQEEQQNSRSRAPSSTVSKEKEPQRPQQAVPDQEDEEEDEDQPIPDLGDLQRRRPNGNLDRAGLKAWKNIYSTALKDHADAAARINAQKQAKKDAWNAEVAQFGEEKARRRLRLERKIRKEQEELLTSDINAMELEESLINPLLKIPATLRIDKKLT